MQASSNPDYVVSRGHVSKCGQGGIVSRERLVSAQKYTFLHGAEHAKLPDIQLPDKSKPIVVVDDDDVGAPSATPSGGGASHTDAGHSTSAGHADVLRDCLCQTLRSAGAIDEDDETVLVDGRFPMYYTGQKHVAGTVKASDLKARTGFNWTVYELKLPSTFPEITPGNSDGFEATLNNTKINSCPNKV